MLIETIKRRVINRKALIAISLISLAGVADILLSDSEGFKLSSDEILSCILGVASTAIIVPLMYLIPIKNRIASSAARGILGAYLIMLLTCFMTMAAISKGHNDFLDSMDVFAFVAIMLPLLMFSPEAIIDGGHVYFVFTLCAIASFLIAEFAEKKLEKKKGDL